MQQTADLPFIKAAESTQIAPARDLYIDRLRSVMTALVILHHTAITYGAVGGWFYNELHPSGSTSSLLLTLFCATQQAYFMGFFFLLAGYFTPASLERKGYARFVGDRFLRLGVPLLAFGLVLGPLTAAIVNAAEGRGFWPAIVWLWNHKQFINGPLWFAQALLIFSLGYCAWRATLGPSIKGAGRSPTAGSNISLVASLCCRCWRCSTRDSPIRSLRREHHRPATRIFLQLHVPLRPRHRAHGNMIGFASSNGSNVRPWIIALVIAWPTLPIGIAYANRIYGPGKASFGGGFTWPAILYAFWEPFVAWGLIAAWLLFARARMNQPSQFWSWLNRRAYAVYIIHPPVLVGVSLLLHPWVAPALLKFCVTGILACVATWLVADPFVRIPGVRRIV